MTAETPAQALPARQTENGTGIAKRVPIEEREVVYMPFQAAEKITLTAGMVVKFLCKPTKRGFVCSAEQAVRFMMLCKARALNPWEGDAFLVGYDGNDGPEFNLITAHQAFLKRAEAHPEFEGMESGVMLMDDNGVITETQGDFIPPKLNLVGGWAKVWRKDRKFPCYRRLNRQVFDKGFSVWKSNPAGMITKCFDEETEVLTEDGFQKFGDATGRILQVADSGVSATDAIPFVQRYSGDMITLNSDDLNFSVTPNHDMITTGGKIEAGALYDSARSRAFHWIPRCVRTSKVPFGMTDRAIQLAAIYLADGYDKSNGSFWVGVSRKSKVQFIESLGGFHSRHIHACAGASTISSGRVITSKTDKQIFGFNYDAISPLAGHGKKISIPTILALSFSQARIFVDTLIRMDGTTNKNTGVRRFYSSRPDLVAAFEVACAVAGYAVSNRKIRVSDISTKDNVVLTISDRSEIGVRRWGRAYKGDKGAKRHHTGLEKTTNESGRVWCVTVPSGVIIVRRNGFSMLCGNCAEADALRSSFPNSLSGMYAEGELGPVQVESHTVPEATPPESRTAALLAKVNKVASRPISEGQTLEPTAGALQEAQDDASFAERLEAKKAEANTAQIAMTEKESAIRAAATQTASTAHPAQPSPDASPVAGNAGQAGETAKEPILITEPADLTSHVKWMTALTEATMDLGADESAANSWVAGRIGDVATSTAKQKAMTGRERHRIFAEFVANFGGIVVKRQAAPAPLEAP